MRAEFFRADQDPGAVQEVTCGWACYQYGHKYALTEGINEQGDGWPRGEVGQGGGDRNFQ